MALVGSVQASHTVSSLTLAVTLPQAATAGNLIRVFLACHAGSAATSSPTITTPAGWSRIGSTSSTSSTSDKTTAGVYYKTAAGGETSVSFTVTDGLGGISALAWELNGASGTLDQNGTAALSAASSSGRTDTSGAITQTAGFDEITAAHVLLSSTATGSPTNTWNNGFVALANDPFTNGLALSIANQQVVGNTTITPSVSWTTGAACQAAITKGFSFGLVANAAFTSGTVLAAAGKATESAAAALTSGTALTSGATASDVGAATLTSATAVTAAASASVGGACSMTSGTTAAVAGSASELATTTLASNTILHGSPTYAGVGTATLISATSLTGSGSAAGQATAALTSTSTLSAAVTAFPSGAAAMSSSTVLVVAATLAGQVSAVIVSSTSLSATGVAWLVGAAPMVSSTVLAAAGVVHGPPRDLTFTTATGHDRWAITTLDLNIQVTTGPDRWSISTTHVDQWSTATGLDRWTISTVEAP